MIGLFCFVLAVLASPFKSKLRLEAENAVCRKLNPGTLVMHSARIGRQRMCALHMTVSEPQALEGDRPR
jgi:hypothetical protein